MRDVTDTSINPNYSGTTLLHSSMYEQTTIRMSSAKQRVSSLETLRDLTDNNDSRTSLFRALQTPVSHRS
jgi:hypothetical protein